MQMTSNKVLTAAEKLMSVDSDDYKNLLEASQDYIEILMQSSISDIVDMLQKMLDQHYINFPFWARLSAFKIICLSDTTNTDFKQWAAGDLSAFGGPEWDYKINQ